LFKKISRAIKIQSWAKFWVIFWNILVLIILKSGHTALSLFSRPDFFDLIRLSERFGDFVGAKDRLVGNSVRLIPNKTPAGTWTTSCRGS
jgi:hypothetical protein